MVHQRSISKINEKQIGFLLSIRSLFSFIICLSYSTLELPSKMSRKNHTATLFYFCFMFKLALTAHELDEIFIQTLQGNLTGYQNWVSKHARKLITFELSQQRLQIKGKYLH